VDVPIIRERTCRFNGMSVKSLTTPEIQFFSLRRRSLNADY